MSGKINIMSETPDQGYNKVVMDISRELSGLNQKFENVEKRLDKQGEGINLINKRLFTGNGETAMSPRLYSVEEKADRAIKGQQSCIAPEMVRYLKTEVSHINKVLEGITDVRDFKTRTWYTTFMDMGKWALVGAISTLITLGVGAVSDDGSDERQEIKQKIESD